MNGTEAKKRVVNKAYEQTCVGDPLNEVTKAADVLDRYVVSKLRDGETITDAHDRLAEAGDPDYCRLIEATYSSRS